MTPSRHNGLFYGPADAPPDFEAKPGACLPLPAAVHTLDFRFGNGLRAWREEW